MAHLQEWRQAGKNYLNIKHPLKEAAEFFIVMLMFDSVVVERIANQTFDYNDKCLIENSCRRVMESPIMLSDG